MLGYGVGRQTKTDHDHQKPNMIDMIRNGKDKEKTEANPSHVSSAVLADGCGGGVAVAGAW